MRSQPVEALDSVGRDLDEARDFYRSWLSDGAQIFEELFAETVRWIEWNPELFPKVYKSFRRAVIRRSYFAIFYAIEPEVTTIVAVIDLRRNPESIRKLLRKAGV